MTDSLAEGTTNQTLSPAEYGLAFKSGGRHAMAFAVFPAVVDQSSLVCDEVRPRLGQKLSVTEIGWAMSSIGVRASENKV